MKQHFLLDPAITFLNHGSYGAVPRPVFETWQRWQAEVERNPVLFLGRRSALALRAARERLGAYLGASADDLVFVPNATTGVNAVLKSLPLRVGEEVLTTDLEYGACLATAAQVCAAAGATLRKVSVSLPLSDAGFTEAMRSAMDERTRLVLLSHITSPTALRLPVEAVIAEAHRRGIPVLIDGAHAPGQIDLDLTALGADFYTGNCHKWLCAPKGTAFLHVRPEHQAQLRATVTSWGDLAGDGATPWDGFIGTQLLERRMQWQGTRDLSGFLAVPAAIDFHAEHRLAERRQQCHTMALALLDRYCRRTGIAPIGGPAHFAQMAPLPLPPSVSDAAALRARLFDEHGIEVPVTVQGGRCFVRASVAVYTDEADLARLEEALLALGY